MLSDDSIFMLVHARNIHYNIKNKNEPAYNCERGPVHGNRMLPWKPWAGTSLAILN